MKTQTNQTTNTNKTALRAGSSSVPVFENQSKTFEKLDRVFCHSLSDFCQG